MTTPIFTLDPARVMKPQLSEILFERVERRFGTLAELSSNVEAIEAGLLFSSGLCPFVAVVGPSGWGKTHLLECAANHMAREFKIRCQIVNATELLLRRLAIESRQPLLIDDAQDVLSKSRLRNQIRLLLERRVRVGLPTMIAFTGDRMTRQHLAFLPHVREWRINEMGEPSKSDRTKVVQKISRVEKVSLSSALQTLIANRMRGNGYTLHGALNRLKMNGSSWQTADETLAACGILNPFFADSPDWDLKEAILLGTESAKIHFPAVDPIELACYAMLTIAKLDELDVARACHLEPAKARANARRFQSRLNDSELFESVLNHFIEIVVENLASGQSPY